MKRPLGMSSRSSATASWGERATSDEAEKEPPRFRKGGAGREQLTSESEAISEDNDWKDDLLTGDLTSDMPTRGTCAPVHSSRRSSLMVSQWQYLKARAAVTLVPRAVRRELKDKATQPQRRHRQRATARDDEESVDAGMLALVGGARAQRSG